MESENLDLQQVPLPPLPSAPPPPLNKSSSASVQTLQFPQSVSGEMKYLKSSNDYIALEFSNDEDSSDDDDIYEAPRLYKETETVAPSNHYGWLLKKAAFYQRLQSINGKIQYFAKIRGKKLLLFSNPSENDPKETVELEGAVVREHRYGKNFLIEERGKFRGITKHVIFTQKKDDMETWIGEIEKAINSAPELPPRPSSSDNSSSVNKKGKI